MLRIVFSCGLCFLLTTTLFSQNSLRNFGNLKAFNNTEIGLKTNLVNDGFFDANKSFLGFYGENQLSVSGAFSIQTDIIEIAVENGILLTTAVNIEGESYFIFGNIKTNKSTNDIAISFAENATYQGESEISKIDGTAVAKNKTSFAFPVGDNERLRPLIYSSSAPVEMIKCSYVSNNPIENKEAITSSKKLGVKAISSVEFWNLESNQEISISVDWNEDSDIRNLTEDLNKLSMVGFHKINKQWEEIETTEATGNLNSGFLSTNKFVPNDFEVIAIGALSQIRNSSPMKIMDLDNYLVSPNNDGLNDFLRIPETEVFSKNRITIFSRNGLKVFEKKDYQNEFRGYGNTSKFIGKNEMLPKGVYFYIISFEENNQEYQGFLYLK